MNGDMSTHVDTQKRSKEKLEKRPKRQRQPIHLTWSKDLIKELRKKTDNISSFTERIIRAVLFEEPAELVAIIPKRLAGRRGFEPPTKGLRVPRSSWLSYRPLCFCDRF